MEVIVIDTGVFKSENYLEGERIKMLLRLVELEFFDIYITEIVLDEIISNFRKDVYIAKNNHKKFTSKWPNYVLKFDKSLLKIFKELEPENIIEKFQERFQKLISTNVIKIIPYKEIDIGTVFKRYFDRKPPFGEGKKKYEFPDAFSMELISDFLIEIEKDVILLTTDSDLVDSNYKGVKIIGDYKKFLSEKLSDFEKEKIEIFNSIYSENLKMIEKAFIDWYKSYLDDYSLYYEVVNYKGVYDIDVESVKVENLEHQITSIKTNLITSEVTATVKVIVNINTDDEDYMYRDDDDGNYYYLETKYEEFSQEFLSTMSISCEINSKSDYVDELYIESINENNKIIIKPHYDNWS